MRLQEEIDHLVVIQFFAFFYFIEIVQTLYFAGHNFFFLLLVLVLDDYAPGSHDVGDPSTTNLYLGNINPQVILEK